MLLEQVLEIRPVDELHRQPRPAVVLAAIVGAGDVGMVELREEGDLALETLGEGVVPGVALRDQLERRPLIAARGEEDLAHGPGAQLALHIPVTNQLRRVLDLLQTAIHAYRCSWIGRHSCIASVVARRWNQKYLKGLAHSDGSNGAIVPNVAVWLPNLHI